VHSVASFPRTGETGIDQIADLLTKPQPEPLFVRQRAILLRWPSSQSPDIPAHLRACDILPGHALTDGETQVNTGSMDPDTMEMNEVSMKQGSTERSGTPKAGPPKLHEIGKELQKTNISATTMTKPLSTELQTYDAWTYITKRNGKGGTKQVSNGSKEHKVWPKEPKVGPKVCKTKEDNNEIGSQII
jgi:hypothetical protein